MKKKVTVKVFWNCRAPKIILTVCIDIKKYTKEFNSALSNKLSTTINTKRAIAQRQQFCQVHSECVCVILLVK